MEDVFAGSLMSSDIVTVEPETDIQEAAEILIEERIGSLVVVDEEDQPTGILTSTDFVRVVAGGGVGEDTAVEDHVSDEVVTVGVNDGIQTAADHLITYDIHHLPVVDETEGVVGVLSTTDLTAHISGSEVPTP